MKKLNIGIAGRGFVGRATEYGFSRNNIFISDPNEGTSTKDLLDKNLDVVFVCAPTPMGANGEIDSSIVEGIISELGVLTDTLIVLKSTVTPTIVGELELRHSNFVYNPEFLTERNANQDFVNPIMQVFGGSEENTSKLENIYTNYSACAPSKVFRMSAKEASLVKYGINSFLSTKVLFWNQYFDICEAVGANYDTVIGAIGHDSRIGHSHTAVPGNDGRRSYGGSCFSKDIPALIKYAQSMDTDFTLLNEAWNSNCKYRNSYESLLDREIAQHISFDPI